MDLPVLNFPDLNTEVEDVFDNVDIDLVTGKNEAPSIGFTVNELEWEYSPKTTGDIAQEDSANGESGERPLHRKIQIHPNGGTGERASNVNNSNRSDNDAAKSRKRKTFTCGDCDKGFSSRHDLTRHTRVHTGERPFTCEECNRSFNDHSNLIKHQRTHSGHQPYECDVCGQRFSRKDTLQLHLINHSGEKPYPCEVCYQYYSCQSILNRHLKTHKNRKPFQCGICKIKLLRKGDLRKHMNTHKGDLNDLSSIGSEAAWTH